MGADFHEQLAHLKDLQHIDLALHRLKTEISFLPKKFADVEESFRSAEGLFTQVTEELRAVEHHKRLDEGELASTTEKLRLREEKLYAIKTNKEYQAAIKEIAEAKKANKEREDRILAAMEQLETLTKKSEQLERDYTDKKAIFEKAAAEVKKEEDILCAKVAEFDTRRPELVSRIDVQILRKYDFIRGRIADAFVAVVKGVCSGCHMNIPPQLYNELLRLKELQACPHCRRLLYAETGNKEA